MIEHNQYLRANTILSRNSCSPPTQKSTTRRGPPSSKMKMLSRSACPPPTKRTTTRRNRRRSNSMNATRCSCRRIAVLIAAISTPRSRRSTARMSQRSYCPPQTRSTIPRRSRWRSRTPHQRDNASSTTRQRATNDAQRPKSRAVDAQRQNAIDNANVAVPAIERVLHCERRANIAAPRHAMDSAANPRNAPTFKFVSAASTSSSR